MPACENARPGVSGKSGKKQEKGVSGEQAGAGRIFFRTDIASRRKGGIPKIQILSDKKACYREEVGDRNRAEWK